jgi:hypothetical protein
MATTAEHSLRYRSRQCDDDIVRDRHAYDTAPFLAQACPMSFEGQKQTFAPQKVMSALPTKADMCSANDDVRFGPKADIVDDHELSGSNGATRGNITLISVNSPGFVSTSIEPPCCFTMMS